MPHKPMSTTTSIMSTTIAATTDMNMMTTAIAVIMRMSIVMMRTMITVPVVTKHHYAFRDLPNTDRADARNGHEEAFSKYFTVTDVFDCLHNDFCCRVTQHPDNKSWQDVSTSAAR